MNITSKTSDGYLKIFYPYTDNQEINIIISYENLPVLISYLQEKLNEHTLVNK